MQDTLSIAQRLYRLKRNQTLPTYRRHLYEPLFHSKAKITGLYGSRGVGKTTLLLQVLDALDIAEEAKLYITCDHPMFYDVPLFDFVDEFAKFGGEVIVIDEIHKIPDFQTQIKLMYDFLDITVYFSGSSAVELTDADVARRYSMYHLPILSFREFLELSFGLMLPSFSLEELLAEHLAAANRIIDLLPDKKILKHFRRFLQEGVYPYYFEDPTKYIDRVSENINAILYNDLLNVVPIDSAKIIALKKLLLTLCVSEPFEFSLDTVGITKPTLYKYIDYLSRAELMHHIVYDAKRFKNLKKPDKLYLGNTNLFRALCLDSRTGSIRETFFVSMLHSHHRITYVQKGDFLVDERYTFEIGGKNKGFEQIKEIPDAYIAADGIEVGFGKKIPLWLFGFVY